MKSYTYFVVKYFVEGDPRPRYVFSDTPDVQSLVKSYPELAKAKCQVMTVTVDNDNGACGKCDIIDFDGTQYMTTGRGTAIVVHKTQNGVDLIF